MSTRYGGLAVTQGLVVCYDFGNAKSYVSGGALYDLSNSQSAFSSPNGGGSVAASGAYLFNSNNSFQGPFNESGVLPPNGGGWTIQTALKPLANNVSEGVWGRTNFPGSGIALGYGQQANKFLFFGYAPGTSSPSFNLSPCDTTQPSVITITYNGTTTYVGYVNGVSGSAGTGVYTPVDTTFFLGGHGQGGWGAMSGYLYSFYVYNRALSPTEVLSNYSAIKGRLGLT